MTKFCPYCSDSRMRFCVDAQVYFCMDCEYIELAVPSGNSMTRHSGIVKTARLSSRRKLGRIAIKR